MDKLLSYKALEIVGVAKDNKKRLVIIRFSDLRSRILVKIWSFNI